MTTYAPPRESTFDHVTASFDAVLDAPLADPIALLDHHTREQLRPPRMASSGPHLAFEDGDQTWLLPIAERITHLGRGLTAHVRIEEQRVSRGHAIIVRHGRQARLLDNRSACGTYLNGRRVIATNLRDGDVIGLGPVVMRYVEND